MGALGVIGSSCDSFLSVFQDLSFDKVTQQRIIKKTINIAIRSTYYIFCQRNKPWNNSELLNFWAFTSFSYYYTFELCYIWIIIIIIIKIGTLQNFLYFKVTYWGFFVVACLFLYLVKSK